MFFWIRHMFWWNVNPKNAAIDHGHVPSDLDVSSLPFFLLSAMWPFCLSRPLDLLSDIPSCLFLSSFLKMKHVSWKYQISMMKILCQSYVQAAAFAVGRWCARSPLHLSCWDLRCQWKRDVLKAPSGTVKVYFRVLDTVIKRSSAETVSSITTCVRTASPQIASRLPRVHELKSVGYLFAAHHMKWIAKPGLLKKKINQSQHHAMISIK